MYAKFQHLGTKTVAATSRKNEDPNMYTDSRVNQEKLGRNRNSSPGSVIVRIQYRFVKQYSLMISTG